MISHKSKLTAILLFGVSAISMPVFAGLDTIIQHVGESLRPKESFESLNKGFTFGDIYSNAHDIAAKEFLATTSQALGNMTDDLNYTYNCNLDINEVSNILLTIDFARNDIQAMAKVINEATPKGNQDSFVGSCTKLINCVSKGKNGTGMYAAIVGGKGVALTDIGFNNCKSLATNAYKRNIQSASSSIALASTNVGNDIYYNGTLDDSPYDILVDIQRIGDVLFATNEQTSKVLFYTFPNNSVAGFQAIPFDGSTRTSSFRASTQLGGNNNQNTSNNINSSTNTSTTFPSSNTNGSNTTTSSTSQGGYKNTIPINGSMSTISTKPSYVDTSNTTIDGGVIDNYACSPSIDNGSTGNIISTDIGNTGDNSTGTSNGVSGDLSQDTIDGIIPPPIFDVNTPYYSPIVGSNDDPIADTTTLEDPAQYEQQATQIESCTSKCNGLKAIDKSMCIAKCMCGTTYTKNGMFGLSICTIPTKQTDIVSSKSVQSIEEIVSEINNVLKNLKQSGEMMKHTKTTEFLDTSLSKIKLNKIFAFDVSISFKPILDTKPRKMTDAQAENETDNLLKGTYGSIDIGEEKNKYVVLGIKNNQTAQDKTTSINLTEIEQNTNTASEEYAARYKAISPALSTSIAASQNAEVADIVRQFLEQNTRFWTFIHDSLDQIQGTASAIRQKIEKGK